MCTICDALRPPQDGCDYDGLAQAAARFGPGMAALSFSASSLPVWTLPQIAYQLTNGYWAWLQQPARKFDIPASGALNVSLSALSEPAKQLATWALDAWTDVTGIRFNLTPAAGATVHITFTEDKPGATFSTVISGTKMLSATVNVSKSWVETYGTGINSYSLQVYVHEIGHALGLGHAGNYNGDSANFPSQALFAQDSWQMSVMSYFSQTKNTWTNASYAFAVTPMLADIAAIQAIYGAPTTRPGDTVYGENSNAGSYLQTLGAMKGAVAWTIYDAGGTDTLDLRSDTNDQVIDLRPGGFTTAYGKVGFLGIAANTVIERALAGSGNDVVHGNAAANALFGGLGNDRLLGYEGDDVLEGGPGADALDGGPGFDIASYAGASARVVASLADPSSNRGDAMGDLYVGIEGLDGSDFNDWLTGDAAHNLLRGGTGNDTLVGGLGHDTLSGGDGGDVLIGGPGADQLLGEAGDDVLNGGPGNDVLDGGDGRDRLSGVDGNDLIRGAGEGDTVSGGLGNDTLLGGDGDDILFGNEGDDLVQGDAGRDRLFGDDGNDSLIGGAMADTLAGGAGNDTLNGGGGPDVFLFAARSGQDVIADYQPGLDRLFLSAGLWPGSLTAQEVVSTYARAVDGGILFAFPGGETILLAGLGAGALPALGADVLVTAG